MIGLPKISIIIALITLIIVIASLVFNKAKQVENGFASKKCWPVGSCKLSEGSGGRREIIPIVFKKPFSSPPVVTGSAYSVDTNSTKDNIRYGINFKNITTKGCDLDVFTWGNTAIYSLGVAWVAVEQ